MNHQDSILCNKVCYACREIIASKASEFLKRQANYWLTKSKEFLIDRVSLSEQDKNDFNQVINSFNKELESQGLLQVA